MSEMSNNDIRTFHLRMSRKEYEKLEKLQETMNTRYNVQLSKTEVILLSIAWHQALIDKFASLENIEKNGSDE